MERDVNFPDILKNRFFKDNLKKVNTYLFEVLENTSKLDEETKNKNLVLLISGPSGSGKDSIIDLLPEKFTRARTCTSRPVRKGELKNDPYIRLSVQEFKKGIKDGQFLETNIYDGNYYGSKVSEIRKVFSLDKVPILRLDASGAKNVLEMLKENPKNLENIGFLYFFIVPPSKKILKERIYKRDVEIVSSLEEKKKAKEKADERFTGTVLKDLDLSKYAHFIVINHDGKLKEVTESVVEVFSKYV